MAPPARTKWRARRLTWMPLGSSPSGFSATASSATAPDLTFAANHSGTAYWGARLAAAGGWGDARVELPEGQWRDVLTSNEFEGGPTRVAGLLDPLPVAVLLQD